MKKDDQYDVSGLTEAQFEPGSNDQVLKNRLGITLPQGMDDAEPCALGKTLGLWAMNKREQTILPPGLVRRIGASVCERKKDIDHCRAEWRG